MKWHTFPAGALREHSEDWDRLQGACGSLPFLETSFIIPLLEEFGSGHELLAFCRNSDGIVAATILTPRRGGLWETFQPAQLPLGAWISTPDIALADLANTLFSALPGFPTIIGITQIDPLWLPRPLDAPNLQTLDYIETAWVDIEADFDAYWESRGKNLRQNLKKARTKLQAEGKDPTLECVTDAASMAQAVREFGTLESAGWKAGGGTAIHPDNAQGRFYLSMLERFSRMERAKVYRYRFGDTVVAMDLCIEAGPVIVILKTSYDEEFKSFSPAMLMRQDEFRELFAAGPLKRIEFYGKLMEWHTRWTDKSRTLYHANVYRWPMLKRLHREVARLRSKTKPVDA